jgi:hypothetical protein
VPYRDRAEHLRQFVPHVLAYFQRDKLDRYISYSVQIIEQLGDEAFNRGRLLNAGFALTRDTADYFCFHDVDYLPIWADYSYVERPTRLIWHGLVLEENYEQFFGGVVAFSRADFERVNGYSNDYWGWGSEDADLRLRCIHAGLTIEHRDGSFHSLTHQHHGYGQEARRTAAARVNAARYKEKLGSGAERFNAEGLDTLKFVEVGRQPCTLDEKTLPNFVHHQVCWST